MPQKKMIHDFLDMKARGEKIAFLTAVRFPNRAIRPGRRSRHAVGRRQPGNVRLRILRARCRSPWTSASATPKRCVGERPTPSWWGTCPSCPTRSSCETAVENAGRFLKEAGVDAIKLEGGVRVASRIRAIVDAGIVVMGHIGLTPQSSGQLGGHKAQGRTSGIGADGGAGCPGGPASRGPYDPCSKHSSGSRRLYHALPVHSGPVDRSRGRLRRAAAHSLRRHRPVSDLLPKFVKKYCDVAGTVTTAMREYVADVKTGAFPGRRALLPHDRGRGREVPSEFA